MRARRPAARREPAREDVGQHVRRGDRIEQGHDQLTAATMAKTRRAPRSPAIRAPERPLPCGSRPAPACGPSARPASSAVADMRRAMGVAQLRPRITPSSPWVSTVKANSPSGASTSRDQRSDQRQVGAIDEHVRRDDQIEAGIARASGGRGIRSGRRHRAGRRGSCARACAIMPGDRSTPSSQSTDRPERGARQARCRSRDRARWRNASAGPARGRPPPPPSRSSSGARIGQPPPARRRSSARIGRTARAHSPPTSRARRCSEARSRRPAPWRSAGSAASACSNAVDRAVAVARALAQVAEREPGRGKAGRELHASAPADRSRRPQIALARGTRAPSRSAGRRSGRRTTETGEWPCCVATSARDFPSETTYLGTMRPEDILVPTPSGVCCKPGGFHIDPTRPVDKALITHGHSDHARAGHGAVLATQETLDIMRLRYGENFAGTTQAIRYGETVTLGRRRRVTFHPAGHVLGSAQIAVERKGLRIVASGDYKDVPRSDLRAVRAGAVRRVHHRGDVRPAGVPPSRSGRARSPSCCARSRCFPERAHLVGAYSLGKAQRVIALHPRGRLRQADLSARRDGEDHALLPARAASISATLRPGARREEGGARRHHHALPAVARCKDLWSRRFPDPVDGLRVGLDAGARPRAAERRANCRW